VKQDNVTCAASTIGLDLGDKFSEYCRLDGEGAVVEEGRVRTSEGVLKEVFGRFPRSVVALEAAADLSEHEQDGQDRRAGAGARGAHGSEAAVPDPSSRGGGAG
jgi:hypothetical protein